MADAPEYQFVTYETLDEGTIARIMLNRADAKNAQKMASQLAAGSLIHGAYTVEGGTLTLTLSGVSTAAADTGVFADGATNGNRRATLAPKKEEPTRMGSSG